MKQQAQALTLSLHGNQRYWLHASELASLHCMQGSVQIQFELDGQTCILPLHADEAPLHLPKLAAGALIKLCRLADRSDSSDAAASVATVIATAREQHSIAQRLHTWWLQATSRDGKKRTSIASAGHA